LLLDRVLITVTVASDADALAALGVFSFHQSSSKPENLLLDTVDNSLSLVPVLVLVSVPVLVPLRTTPSICSLAIKSSSYRAASTPFAKR
jgi:hypothetical protein